MTSVAVQQGPNSGFGTEQTEPIDDDRAGLHIPSRYKDLLEPIEILDARSDDEILESLTGYVPVTSEKNVWAFWHAGVRAMPSWNQRNVIDWIRICGSSGWTVRILDSVPDSPNYATRYIDPTLLPEAYKKGTLDGPWAGPHSADFVRGASLWTHGGICMDVGCILLRDLDRICWNKMTEPGSLYQIAAPSLWGQTIANYFVAARKGDPFVKRWHDLFVHVWTGHTSAQGLADDPLISSAVDIVSEDMQAAQGSWEVHVPYKTVMEYIGQLVCWQRVCMLEDAGDGFSGVDYWMNHVYLFDAVQETVGGETKVGFDQQRMFRFLTMKRDDSAAASAKRVPEHDYEPAKELTWYLLTSASMLKISRGSGLTRHKGFGAVLDEPENKDKHCEPDTFFELLRFGSLNFKQTREGFVTVKPSRPRVTLKKGLTEL
ncbi:hypothetical protein K431DRAFT_282048 [Polychaeton citri CBS 116435]|uniref:Capsule polysaccharide biosynthesis protein n=1 Tax=Polychaeton citri CBS 116435 TaxID=1314669 RepID=A0A9P4QGB0_9PEZI|nr:hypothetical protein K431DRAFT_282048 [Polychaeton citri CBS 116435]